ncbi:hypothetical protein OSTOST_06470 [Ostertagia ostertagi]
MGLALFGRPLKAVSLPARSTTGSPPTPSRIMRTAQHRHGRGFHRLDAVRQPVQRAQQQGLDEQQLGRAEQQHQPGVAGQALGVRHVTAQAPLEGGHDGGRQHGHAQGQAQSQGAQPARHGAVGGRGRGIGTHGVQRQRHKLSRPPCALCALATRGRPRRRGAALLDREAIGRRGHAVARGRPELWRQLALDDAPPGELDRLRRVRPGAVELELAERRAADAGREALRPRHPRAADPQPRPGQRAGAGAGLADRPRRAQAQCQRVLGVRQQPARHAAQAAQRVAGLVAEALVDELEAVQVGRQQREAGAAGRRQLGQAGQRGVAVGQVGEFVVQRLAAQRLGGALALGVVQHQHEQRRAAFPFEVAGDAAHVDGAAIGAVALTLPGDLAAALLHELRVARPGTGEIGRRESGLDGAQAADAVQLEHRQRGGVGVDGAPVAHDDQALHGLLVQLAQLRIDLLGLVMRAPHGQQDQRHRQRHVHIGAEDVRDDGAGQRVQHRAAEQRQRQDEAQQRAEQRRIARPAPGPAAVARGAGEFQRQRRDDAGGGHRGLDLVAHRFHVGRHQRHAQRQPHGQQHVAPTPVADVRMAGFQPCQDQQRHAEHGDQTGTDQEEPGHRPILATARVCAPSVQAFVQNSGRTSRVASGQRSLRQGEAGSPAPSTRLASSGVSAQA